MPGKDRDEESGEYSVTYPDSEFLQAIQELGGLAGTSDIAKQIGCTRRTAYQRLLSLESEEQVESQKIGNSLVWSLPE